jgi:hypothetical protein
MNINQDHFTPTAKVIVDSINQYGNRLTTMEVTFHRYILAEINTHREFCLCGDSELHFDLPAKLKKNKHSLFKMKLSEFVDKWHNGAALRKNKKRNQYNLSQINPDKVYKTTDIKILTGYNSGNLHTAIRAGILPEDRRNITKQNRYGNLFIKGSDFINFLNRPDVNRQPMKDRLQQMSLRCLNESTRMYTHTKITDCWYSGKKETFKVLTESGQFIIGSKDHRIFTDSGWKIISDLQIGEKLAGKYVSEDEPRKQNYTNKKINGRWVNQWIREIKPTIVNNQNQLCNFCLSEIQNNKCDIHHLIPIHIDKTKAFEIENVVAVCLDCHQNQHKTQEWQTGNPLSLRWEKIIAIINVGERDTYDVSVAGEFQNFVANGLVVHNSRNSASSRAIPFSKTSKKVREMPALPLHYGVNKPGMSADSELADEQIRQVEIYLNGIKNHTLDILELINDEYHLHKQVINRYIEPFMSHTAIISATEWDNFFWQRCHPAADPVMKAAADAMQYAYYTSVPTEISYGYWHLPYVDVDTINEVFSNNILTTTEMIEVIKKVSAARCARVSYLTQSGIRDWTEDLALYNRLVTADVLHASPLEHVATPANGNYRLSNFKGWNQFRHVIQDSLPSQGPFIPNHPLLISTK